jgi:hypothetical protein
VSKATSVQLAGVPLPTTPAARAVCSPGTSQSVQINIAAKRKRKTILIRYGLMSIFPPSQTQPFIARIGHHNRDEINLFPHFGIGLADADTPHSTIQTGAFLMATIILQ